MRGWWTVTVTVVIAIIMYSAIKLLYEKFVEKFAVSKDPCEDGAAIQQEQVRRGRHQPELPSELELKP